MDLTQPLDSGHHTNLISLENGKDGYMTYHDLTLRAEQSTASDIPLSESVQCSQGIAMSPKIVGFDTDRPIELMSAKMEGFDMTEVDLGNVELFTVRQFDEDGKAHVVLLTPKMITELVQHMNAWVALG